jgi:hypothetical protein
MKIANRIITDPGEYPIKPSHINIVNQVLYQGFDYPGKAISARAIVELCQRRGSWAPFGICELNNVMSQVSIGAKSFYFNGLDKDGLIVVKDDVCYLTHEFVTKCFFASPAVPGLQLNKEVESAAARI